MRRELSCDTGSFQKRFLTWGISKKDRKLSSEASTQQLTNRRPVTNHGALTENFRHDLGCEEFLFTSSVLQTCFLWNVGQYSDFATFLAAESIFNLNSMHSPHRNADNDHDWLLTSLVFYLFVFIYFKFLFLGANTLLCRTLELWLKSYRVLRIVWKCCEESCNQTILKKLWYPWS